MTLRKSPQQRLLSLLAAGAAATLVTGGVVLAPTAALAAADDQGVKITAIVGDPNASTNFEGNPAINPGSKVTLTGSLPATIEGNSGVVNTGVYAQWCQRPADGERPASDTCNPDAQAWLMHTSIYGQPAVGSVADGVWTFDSDFAIPATAGELGCGAVGTEQECGVFIRADHQAGQNRTLDQFIPVSMAVNAGEASSVTAAVTATSGGEIVITGTANGVALEQDPTRSDSGKKPVGFYFGLFEKGTANADGTNFIAAGLAYRPAPYTETGSAEIKVKTSSLDSSKQYEIITWRAHGNLSTSRYLGRADVVITEDQINRANTAFTAGVAEASEAGLTVEASASGFKLYEAAHNEANGDGTSNDTGVYFAVIEAGTVGDLSMGNQGVYADFIPKSLFKEGVAGFTGVAPKAKLDPTKSYEVVVWRAHGNANEHRILGIAPLNVTAKQWATVFPIDARVTRFDGKNRYETNAKVNSEVAQKGKPVFIATGTDFPDALAIGPAVTLTEGSLFLAQAPTLSAAVEKQIKDLEPSEIYIVGGAGIVPESIASQLKKATGTTPERIFGANRYATSAQIFTEFFAAEDDVPVAFLATGRDYPDALSAAAAGGALAAPVLLSDGSTLHADVSKALKAANTEALLFVGGTGVLSASLENSLKNAYDIERLQGANRYLTNKEVNDFIGEAADEVEVELHEVWVATGNDFPDALSAAVPAGWLDSRLVLSNGQCLPKTVVSSWIKGSGSLVDSVYLVGGEGVLSRAVASLTECK